MADVVMLVSNRHSPDPRVQKEARSLVEAGHRVTILAWDRGHELPQHAVLDGVVIRRLRARTAKLGSLIATARGLASFHELAKRRLLELAPDVVHCHDHDTCAVGVWWKRRGARRAGRRSPGTFVFDAHDLYWTWLTMPDPKSRWRKGAARALRLRDRWYARQADLLVTVTEQRGRTPGLAEIYRDWGANPVVVVNASPRVETMPALPEQFTLGYTGMVREPLMFRWLTEAIARLPKADRPLLRIAGGGVAQQSVAGALTEFGREHGVTVRITEAFTMDQIPALLAETSVQYCVYPTARGNMDRTLPVKLLESVAHGRPVIANSGTLMGTWVEDGNWGWCVKEGVIDELAEAIKKAAAWHRGLTRTSMQPPPYWDEQGARLVAAYAALGFSPPATD
jgi:glycosyltransferase involved in cell wall biosynthesis